MNLKLDAHSPFFDDAFVLEDQETCGQVVKSIIDRGIPLTLWQKQDSGLRTTKTILSESLVMQNNSFVIKGAHNIDVFGPGKDLYFYSKESNVIFRSLILKKQANHMILHLPQKVKTQNARKHKRYYLGPYDYNCTLVKKVKNTMASRYQIPLFDISNGGLGVILEQHHTNSIREGDFMRLLNVNQNGVSPHLQCLILYVVPFKHKGQKKFKAGILFEEGITIGTIKTFLPVI